MINRLKRIWYRKQIASLKKRVEETHYNFLGAMKYAAGKVGEWATARSLCEKFNDEWHRDAARTKQKEFRESKEWAMQRKTDSMKAQKQYTDFMVLHGIRQ